MKAKHLAELGLPKSVASLAGVSIRNATKQGVSKDSIKSLLADLATEPEKYLNDQHFSKLAEEIARQKNTTPTYTEREIDAPYQVWGEGFEDGALKQIENACKLPVSVCGALMPDAHQGYGLPIGGVLAADNAVIPYAVGMDIACRMKLTIYEQSPIVLRQEERRFIRALEEETAFGVNASFRKPREHSVMDEDWNITKTTQQNKDKARAQLGSSGSGNHFVEFGELTIESSKKLGLEPGRYLALLSHSGSRGVGGSVARHYSKLAQSRHPELPKELQHLAWLSLDTYEGQQYWKAMELMGLYAAANHDCIHHHVTKAVGGKIIAEVENHHNFAWKEDYHGKMVVVHRKGATPAHIGTLGIIPGTMADVAYVVSGLGKEASINSSSHGAGRKMSRTEAKRQFTWNQTKKYLDDKGVKLLSAGLDECPMAYKDIDEVMNHQRDLVEIIAKFQPRLVRMAPGKN